jgi:hypothetical protein
LSRKPGLCQILEHEIHVTPDFKPKRLKEYRIPEKFKSEVDRQIQELLQLGLIHESTSPQASPVVCVRHTVVYPGWDQVRNSVVRQGEKVSLFPSLIACVCCK